MALKDAAHLLLDQARIMEGEALPDPTAYAKRMADVHGDGLQEVNEVGSSHLIRVASLTEERSFRSISFDCHNIDLIESKYRPHYRSLLSCLRPLSSQTEAYHLTASQNGLRNWVIHNRRPPGRPPAAAFIASNRVSFL